MMWLLIVFLFTSECFAITGEEKEYIGRAGGYLSSLNKLDTEVAMIMAGANTGESTLGDIENAIKKARNVESYAWTGDYLNNGKLVVSPVFSKLHGKIEKCHKLHISAWNELLEYWKDSNIAHIQSGNSVLKTAVLLTNECINDLSLIMKSLK